MVVKIIMCASSSTSGSCVAPKTLVVGASASGAARSGAPLCDVYEGALVEGKERLDDAIVGQTSCREGVETFHRVDHLQVPADQHFSVIGGRVHVESLGAKDSLPGEEMLAKLIDLLDSRDRVG